MSMAQSSGRYHLRRLRPGDEAALTVLAQGAARFEASGHGVALPPLAPADAEAFVADDHTICIVALEEGTNHIAGFAYANVLYRRHTQLRHLCLYEIGVDHDHRSRGVARILMDGMAAEARQEGIDRGFVITQESNVEAMDLYRSVGGVTGVGTDVVFALRF